MGRPRGLFTKGLLLILFAGVAVGALSLIPLSPLKQSVQSRLSDTLGRKVTVDSVRLNLIGSPHLVLTGVTALEDPAFGDGVFLSASEVRAGVDVIQYLRSRVIVIDSIIFKSPQITLVKNRDGVWSWSTLGKRSSETSTASSFLYHSLTLAALLSPPNRIPVGPSTLREVKFENASVKLRDNGGTEPSELLYRNLALNASLTPAVNADSGHSTQARGNLVMRSVEDGEADRFEATLPFDIKIDDRGGSTLSLSGSIGPGPIDTGNISIGSFAINGEIYSNNNSPLTGKGQLSLTDLDIQTANLSERVARALKVDQIGDMSPGTAVTDLATDFQISEGTVHTTGLRIQQLDGLGDASAPNGDFKIDAALIVNYAATVVLSPEATSRVKSMSTALGLVVTILETNNRLSVPINVSGDVRNPEVQVDVSRIF